MCLIIVKPKGIPVKEEWLINSLMSNRDGWGIMWSDGGKVHVEKGLKDKGLLTWASKLDDTQAVFHMRLATSGLENLANCHPFPVGNGMWLMHNGIFNIPQINEKWSDTKHFAEYVIRPMLQAKPELFGTKAFEGIVSYLIGSGNKVVLMNAEGNVQIINASEGVERDGCWLSNTYSLYPYQYRDYRYQLREDFSAYRGDGWRSTYGAYTYSTKTCFYCQRTNVVRNDEWEYVAGVGTVCTDCYYQRRHDFDNTVSDTPLHSPDVSKIPDRSGSLIVSEEEERAQAAEMVIIEGRQADLEPLDGTEIAKNLAHYSIGELKALSYNELLALCEDEPDLVAYIIQEGGRW